MNISQALISLNSFPIPSLFIDKVGVDRGLILTDEYTLAVSTTNSYRLATADVFFWLSQQPSIKEQEVGINQASDARERLLNMANDIYFDLDPEKYTGNGTYGFKGENF